MTFIMKRSAMLAAGKRGVAKARVVLAARTRNTPGMPVVKWLLRPEIPMSDRERPTKATKADKGVSGSKPEQRMPWHYRPIAGFSLMQRLTIAALGCSCPPETDSKQTEVTSYVDVEAKAHRQAEASAKPNR